MAAEESTTVVPGTGPEDNIFYVTYTDETMLPDIQRLVSKDLSEPYSIFTYRYFVHNWPDQCICGFVNVPTADGAGTRREMIATIVSKAEEQEFGMKQGYIAMLAVDKRYRNRGIGSYLVRKGIEAMVRSGCSEIMLETEASNKGALSLYTRLGFVKDDKMVKYYLNGGDAYRLKLWVDRPSALRVVAPFLLQQEEGGPAEQAIASSH